MSNELNYKVHFFQSKNCDNDFALTYQVWIGFEDFSYMGFVWSCSHYLPGCSRWCTASCWSCFLPILVKMKLHKRGDKSFLCVCSGSLQSRCIGYSRRRDIHLLIQNAQQLLATPKILQKYSLHACIQKTSTKMNDVVHSGNMIHHQINSNCYISLGYKKKNRISPLKQATSPCKVCMSLGAHKA